MSRRAAPGRRAAAKRTSEPAPARSEAPEPEPRDVPAVRQLMPGVPILPLHEQAQDFDREIRAAVGRATGSLSVASALLAGIDWWVNLFVSPGKQAELQLLALKQGHQLAQYAAACFAAGHLPAAPCVTPPAADRRFDDEAWQHWPFNVLHQSFLMTERWWAEATRGVAGVERHHQELVAFIGRQLLDFASPGNSLWTNPVALKATRDENGLNLARGAVNVWYDFARIAAHMPPPGADQYVVGRDVAITPGKVVLRNRLIELIQYAPATPQVHPEPVLIVPAWIMKFYILDLTPENSLVKYLVGQGHTVFCISWKNPTAEDRDMGLADYLDLSVYEALDAIGQIVPDRKVHALGYCLGGTLLSIAAAAMARDRRERLASITLLAAQTEFSEPGELALFIDESQVDLLDAEMRKTGYLDARQMAGAFQMLRSYDLLWSQMVNRYLLGQPLAMNDLMAWNYDTTRMPARMQGEYLRHFFLHDDLAERRYRVDGRPVSLTDVKVPVFLVGTVTDHVAPWRSVYKLHYLTETEITFVLTSGGHNAGIVSPPGHSRRHYQLLTSSSREHRLDQDAWLAAAPDYPGSWWPAWQGWLAARSGAPGDPPSMGMRGQIVADAPGAYVLEK